MDGGDPVGRSGELATARVRRLADEPEVESGARNVDNILTNTLLPDLSRMLLTEIVEGRKPERIRVSVATDGGFEYELDRPKKLELAIPVVSA